MKRQNEENLTCHPRVSGDPENTESLLELDSRIFTKSENDGNETGNAEIATGLSAPRNDNKKGSVIANEVKQSRQTLLRHPEFISGSTNESMWTLKQVQSEGTDSFIRLASRIFTKSENDRNGRGHAEIAASPKAPRNDSKKGRVIANYSPRVIANAVKQSRQTLLRHPEFISGSINSTMWTLKQVQSDKRLMSGRSLTETLGVLALIAVLSIGAVLGLRYTMDKNKANRVLYDVNLGFAEIQGIENRAFNILFNVSFIPESGYEIDTMRVDDKNSSVGYTDIVIVDGIEENVCNILKNMKGVNGLSIFEYDEETDRFIGYKTCEKDDNQMIFSLLNIQGICDKACPKNSTCIDYECVCEWGYEKDGDDCVKIECPEEVTDITSLENEYCCSLQTGTVWTNEQCQCAEGYFLKDGFCAPAGDFCIYGFDGLMDSGDYVTDCSYTYTMTEENETLGAYVTDCSYTYDENANPKMAEDKPCDDGQYCVLNWATENCSSEVRAEGATTIYGRCSDLTFTYNACAIENALPTPKMVEDKPCDDGQYCVLNWATENCSNEVRAEGATTIYGRCSDLTFTYNACAVENQQELNGSAIVGCGQNQYCHLLWSNQQCGNVASTGFKYVYGKCIDLTDNNAQCPMSE